jgi:two-component system response regulator FixJ
MDNISPTVFVVDDDEAICRSLRLLIEEIGLNVETFHGAQDFLDAYDPTRLGCLVLDVRMSGMSGLDLQSELRRMGVDIPIIIITGHSDVPMAVQAMKAGVIDFIEKPFRDQVMLDSVQRALDYDAQARRERAERTNVETKLSQLTQRERQIMDLLVTGKPNKVIAYELGISQKTVDFHRAHIFEKMRVDSVVELVRFTLNAHRTQ